MGAERHQGEGIGVAACQWPPALLGEVPGMPAHGGAEGHDDPVVADRCRVELGFGRHSAERFDEGSVAGRSEGALLVRVPLQAADDEGSGRRSPQSSDQVLLTAVIRVPARGARPDDEVGRPGSVGRGSPPERSRCGVLGGTGRRSRTDVDRRFTGGSVRGGGTVAADPEYGSRSDRTDHLVHDGLVVANDPVDDPGAARGIPPPAEGVHRKGSLPQLADRPVDDPDPCVDGFEAGECEQAVRVHFLVVVDDGGRGRYRGERARIVDGEVPSDIECLDPDPLGGKPERHGDLVDVHRPVEEQFGAVEEPRRPRCPGRRHPRQHGALHQIEPAVAVPRCGELAVAPGQGNQRRQCDARRSEDPDQHPDRGQWPIHGLPGHTARPEVESAGILQHDHIGIAEHGEAVDPAVGEVERRPRSCCSAASGGRIGRSRGRRRR